MPRWSAPKYAPYARLYCLGPSVGFVHNKLNQILVHTLGRPKPLRPLSRAQCEGWRDGTDIDGFVSDLIERTSDLVQACREAGFGSDEDDFARMAVAVHVLRQLEVINDAELAEILHDLKGGLQ
jgi:hypothetical protein